MLPSQSSHTHTRTGGKPWGASSANGTNGRCPSGRSLTKSVLAWRARTVSETEGSAPDKSREGHSACGKCTGATRNFNGGLFWPSGGIIVGALVAISQSACMFKPCMNQLRLWLASLGD